MAWTYVTTGPVIVLSETAQNSSNKTLTASDLPEYYKEIEIEGIRVEFSSTATVGNRQLRVQLCRTSDNDVIAEQWVGPVIAASVTRNKELIPGGSNIAEHTFNTNQDAYQYMVKMSMGDGIYLKVFDSTAVDPLQDDMVVHVRGRQI